MSKCIIITGIKHSGKTTTGKMLAKQLEVPFYDIDQIIEEQNKTSCRELYTSKGFEAFQKAELEACIFLVQTQKKIIVTGSIKAVVSTGGGICENTKALELLQAIGIFINLDIPKEVAFDRILASSKRTQSLPASLTKNAKTDNDIKKAFYEQYEKRTSKYKGLSSVCIKTSKLSPDDVCYAIVKKLTTALLI